jgi:hypothetical protein
MADPFLAQSDLDRTLEALPSPGSVTQTPGLSGLAPSLADLSVMQQRTLGEISALGRGGTAQQPVIQQNIAYSPSTKKYWVNDTLVDTGDVASMLQGASRATAPGQPAPGNVARDWVPVTQQDFTRTVAQLRQPRGFLENVGLGAAGAVEGLVGGIGRGLEIMGAPSVGKPIAEFAESTFGQSEYNKQRDALIQQSNSLFSNIMDAVARGVPSVGLSALLGVGGAVGGAALAARAGLSAARGAMVGAGAGAGAAVFPSEIQGLYEAAQKGGYNVEDPGVQNEILAGALGSSILQTIVPAYAGKAFASPLLQRRSREIAEEVIKKQAGSRAAGVAGVAAGAGLTEALAEGTAALIQQAAFDPEFRKKLSREDIKALVPFIADKYGENIVIAMGAGAILGAGFGGAGKFLGDRPVNLNQVAEEKSVAEDQGTYGPFQPYGPPEAYGPPTPPPTEQYGPTTPSFAYQTQLGLNLQAPPSFAGLPLFEAPRYTPAPAPAPVAQPAPAPAYVAPDTRGLPLFEAAQQPLQIAPGAQLNLFPGAVEQRAPAQVAPPFTTPQQLSLPLEGRQLALNLQQSQTAPAPLPVVPPPAAPLPGSTPEQRAAAFEALTPSAAPSQRNALQSTRVQRQRDADAQLAPTIITNVYTQLDDAQQQRLIDAAGGTPAQLNEFIQTQYNLDGLVVPQLARIAGVDPRVLTTEGGFRAAPEGQKPEGGLRKRTDVGERRPPTEAGGRNRLEQRRQEQAPAQAEVATETDRNVWDTFFDDGGVGYDKLPDAGKAEWRALVLRGDITIVEADAFQAKYTAPKTPAPKKATLAKAAPETPARPPAGAAETPSTTAAPVPQPETEAKPSSAPVEPVATASTETRTEVERDLATARMAEVEARLKAIPREMQSAGLKKPQRDALAAERDRLEDERESLRAQMRGQKVDTPFGAGAIVDEANKAITQRAKQQGYYDKLVAERTDLQQKIERGGRGLLKQEQLKALDKMKADLKAVDAQIAKFEKLGFGPEGVANFSLVGFNTVTGAIDYEGKPIARPMAEGRVRMAVRDLLSKLTVKPNVRIFKDQADLKARDPALYREAVAGRPQGDFDTANAAGYSFGDNRVIIFSDRIANDRHLRFVLAHETIGHMGLRALMPANKFDPFMESLYDANPRIQSAVDAAMKNRDLSKAEAVEEYLADYAGLLETSMVRRVWDAIKGGLNKLGVKFGDEAARYWLDQAKRYVRTGEAAMFDAAAIAERLQAVETGQVGPGRFSIAGIRNDQQRFIDAVFNARLPTNVGDGMADLRRLGGGVNEWWDKFKGKYLSLANYRALNNPGLTVFEQIQSEMTGYSQEVIRRFADRLTPILDSPTAAKASEAVYNMRAFADAKAAEQPAPSGTSLFTIGKDGEPQVKQAEVNALFNKHIPTLKELQDGVTLTFKDRIGDREVTRTVEIPADKTLTKQVYDEAIALRRMMADIEVEVLRERIKSRLEADEIAYKAASRIMKTGEFTADERRFAVDTARKAKGFINDEDIGPGQSDKFLAAVNEAIIAKGFDEKKTDALRPFFDDANQADAYIERLKNFRKNVNVTDANKFILQNKVREIIAADAAFDRHTRQVKRSIVNGYVPVMRTGGKQVRVAALVDGKPVTLAPEWQDALVLAHFDGEVDAQRARETLNTSFKGKTIEALVLDTEATADSKQVYKPMQVTLVARVGDVLEVPATDPRTNLDDFLSVMRRLNINLTPSEMERVITTLTATTDAARRRLQFANTPGYDRSSAPTSIAKHIQSRSSTIGKLYAIPKMDQLLDRDGDMFKYWAGNREGVIALKEQFDNAKTDAERTRFKRGLDMALYQYKQTNIGADKWDGSRASAPPEDQITRDRVNRYYNESVRTLDSIVSARSLTESEFENQRGISELRAGASIMYLGASISNGLLNLASVQTNWLPYMASHNAKNGFGGGFGVGRTQAELLKAMKQVGGIGAGKINFRAAEYFDRVANDAALLKKHGLTKIEAEFIAEQTRRGVMVPAESNALLSTALGRENRPYLRKFVDTIMYPFNATEQAARRSAGLAAFRLEYDRQIAAGVSSKDAVAAASDFAAQSLKLTLGEYNVLNRPPAWRQGLPGLLYTFKTYPTTTIQLLRNMSPKGQVAMLAMLWMMSGVAGFPLAEDVEDIVDTIAQKLGVRWSGGRIELAKLLDEVMPGVSPYVLKGVVTEFMGLSVDLGAKFSMGDVIPGTGIFLAGAKPQEELLNLAGPVASAGIGMLGMARDIVTFPFSSTKTLEDVARNSPMTFLRTLGDASAYLNTGAIVDRRGYVVSNELTTGTIIGRLMGFYPKEAADQYDVIKYMNRTVNYQKEATAGFRQAWIKAKLRGDEETAATIRESVADWNDATRGTALEMRNWLSGSQRALREAQREAVQRTLKTTPLASRQDLTGYANLLVD